MFGDYRHNSSPSAIFTPAQSRDRRKNSSAAMFTTRPNHSHGHVKIAPDITAVDIDLFFFTVPVQ